MTEWDIALNAFKAHGKWIISGACIGIVFAFLIFLYQKPVWQAEMVVGPTDRTGIQSLSSILPQGAADAPALQYFVKRIDASQSSDFTRFETLLESPQITRHLIREDQDIVPFKSVETLQVWLNDNLQIRPYGLTPYRKVTLRHTDGAQAAAILGRIYSHSDQTVRQDTRIKTDRRIVYLKNQLDIVRNPDHRNAVISLLKEQEQTAMMVAIDNAFAGELIVPPTVLAEPIAPKAVILFPALTIAGAIIGFMLGGLIRALQQ